VATGQRPSIQQIQPPPTDLHDSKDGSRSGWLSLHAVYLMPICHLYFLFTNRSFESSC
jgi:hypothetical protein